MPGVMDIPTGSKNDSTGFGTSAGACSPWEAVVTA
jgi:hypothetical protein